MTYFTPSSCVASVNFEHVIVSWDRTAPVSGNIHVNIFLTNNTSLHVSVFFFRMYGFFQTVFYFGYMALFSVALGIMCGKLK